MTTKHFILLARYSFWVSFVIGTILLLLEKTTELRYDLMSIGLLYVILAFLLNSVIFMTLVIVAIIKKESSIFFNACLMLLNIPITFIYITLI